VRLTTVAWSVRLPSSMTRSPAPSPVWRWGPGGPPARVTRITGHRNLPARRIRLILAFRIRHGRGPSGQAWEAQAAAGQARETVAFFRNDLTPHFRAEEEVIFPVLEPYLQPGERVVAELREELARLAALVRELEGGRGTCRGRYGHSASC
jgi:hypothetical protein